MSSKAWSMLAHFNNNINKPNLVLHKITKLHLTKQNEIIVYIFNEGHNLQTHMICNHLAQFKEHFIIL